MNWFYVVIIAIVTGSIVLASVIIVQRARSRQSCCQNQNCGPSATCPGTNCGSCPNNQVCQNGLCGNCNPNCAGRQCGPALNCPGISCGNCSPDTTCVDGLCQRRDNPTPTCPNGCPAEHVCTNGVCVPCTPNCADRQCGPAPNCPGSNCGSCYRGECNTEGRCVCPAYYGPDCITLQGCSSDGVTPPPSWPAFGSETTERAIRLSFLRPDTGTKLYLALNPATPDGRNYVVFWSHLPWVWYYHPANRTLSTFGRGTDDRPTTERLYLAAFDMVSTSSYPTQACLERGGIQLEVFPDNVRLPLDWIIGAMTSADAQEKKRVFIYSINARRYLTYVIKESPFFGSLVLTNYAKVPFVWNIEHV